MQEAIVETEWGPTKQELKAYFAELVPMLNLRLLCEMERMSLIEGENTKTAVVPTQMLWVEGITLISYEQPKKEREEGTDYGNRRTICGT